MNKNIDACQQAVRDEVKAFAEKEIYPVSVELDQMPEPRKFPTELYKKIAQAGFIGYAMPRNLAVREDRILSILPWSKNSVTMMQALVCSVRWEN